MYSFFGLTGENEAVEITFEEVVKAAGHVCPTVAGAYLLAKRALSELFQDELPVRGNVKVTVFGPPDIMVNGPIAQVFNHILGAAHVTGFKGLKGKFVRKDLLTFIEGDIKPMTFDFERTGTDRKIRLTYTPEVIKPAGPEENASSLLPAAIKDDASQQDKERFQKAWLARVFKILANPDKVIKVEKL